MRDEVRSLTRTPVATQNAAPVTRGRINAWHVWSLVAAIALAGVHYGVAHPGDGPRIFADEIGYLANARYLAGGRHIDMNLTAFYDGGWSLVLAPLSRLFASNPGRLYRSILILEAMMAGASMLLVAQLCRWLLGTPKPLSIVIAFAAGLYPSFVVYSGFAWSESMLTFTLLIVITSAVWLMRGAEESTRNRFSMSSRAVLLGAASGLLVTVHNRTVLAVLATLAIVCWFLLRRHALDTVAVLLAVSAVGAGGGELLNRHLKHVLWAGAGGIDPGGKLTSLLHPHGLWAAGLTFTGQYWAQLAATGGLVAIGLLGLAFAALGRFGARRAAVPIDSRRLGAAIVVVVFASLLVVSATFLARGQRADSIVYGRYVDIVTPLLVALAIAWLATSPPTRALACGAAVLVASVSGAAIILDYSGKTELARAYNRMTTIAILGWLDYRRNSPALVRTTIWTAALGLVAIGGVFFARDLRRRSWTAPVAISLGIIALFGWQFSFVGPKVLNGLSDQSKKTRAVVDALRQTGTDEIRLEPTVMVVDRLAFEYWLPKVRFVQATPANDRCANGVSIGRTLTPPSGEVLIANVGAFALFHGTEHCQSL